MIDQNNMALASEGIFYPVNQCDAVANAAPQTAGDLSDYYPGVLSVNKYEGDTYGLPGSLSRSSSTTTKDCSMRRVSITLG